MSAIEGSIGDMKDQVDKLGAGEAGLKEEDDVREAALRGEESNVRDALRNSTRAEKVKMTRAAAPLEKPSHSAIHRCRLCNSLLRLTGQPLLLFQLEQSQILELSEVAVAAAARMHAISRGVAEQGTKERDAIKRDVAGVIPKVKKLFSLSETRVNSLDSRLIKFEADVSGEDSRIAEQAKEAEADASRPRKITVSVSGSEDEKLVVSPGADAQSAHPAFEVPAVRRAAKHTVQKASAKLDAALQAGAGAKPVVEPRVVEHHKSAVERADANSAEAVVKVEEPAVEAAVQAQHVVVAKPVAEARTKPSAEVVKPQAEAKTSEPVIEANAKTVVDAKAREQKTEDKKVVEKKTPCLVHMSKYVKNFQPDSPEEC